MRTREELEQLVKATPEWSPEHSQNDGFAGLPYTVKPASGLQLTAPEPPWPESLHEDAYHGPMGDFVRAIEPHTEADPAGVLVQGLVAFGNVVGRAPYFPVEADYHRTNLFCALVGRTAKGRKGTSWGQTFALYRAVDEAWANHSIQAGLSSGEGLIWAVRDAIVSHEPVKEKGRVVDYQDVENDPGVADKRLLVVETELASTLRVLGREGNTLSAVIRNAWDTGDLRVLTKNSPARATGAHISIIGHITRDEVLRELRSTEAGNGFANRFLWVCVQRSKVLPEGGQLHTVDMGPHHRRFEDAALFARSAGEMSRDEQARGIWRDVYEALSDGRPGLFGAVTARAEAQVMRLACIYALLDRTTVIRREHLRAGLAVWGYCEESARHIFGEALGAPVTDALLDALRAAPEGLTRSAIRGDLFSRNQESAKIEAALHALQDRGLVKSEHVAPDGGKGRPAERWRYVGGPRIEESTGS